MGKIKKPGTQDDLRTRAEARMEPKSEIPMSSEAADSLIHELRVHQVELELQNEELRETQAELEESRARYADLYDFAPVGYLTFDEHGSILEANLTAARQLGIERSYLIHKFFRLYLPQPDRDAFHAHLHAVFTTRERQTCEVRPTAKNGKQFHARLESIFIEGAAGDGRCRTSLIDITLTKEAEEAVKKSRDELASANGLLRLEVAERVRAEKELEVYAAKLECSNREFQDFAFIASHDMQEPLRKIQVFSTMIKEKYAEALGDEGRDFIHRMRNAAKRMTDMVEGLLEYSRVATRAKPFDAVDLTALVRETANDLEILVEKTDARIEIGDLPALEADPAQMSRLFQNLISNGLKFHGEEKPVIKIYARPACDGPEPEAGGRMHRIFVEDNGIGFNEKDLDLIFTMFRRLNGRSAYEGTGMGLAICRRIVERHHGHITARSTPGNGATFIITLPERHPPEK